MLSRVAAVKAPRTHNRRRVTGSSGRMREGRESEPQRPNMSWHLFFSAVLLLVVMVCCGSGGAVEVGGQPSVPKFEWKGINEGEGETVESLGAPSLLNVGSDVFAVAEAQCKKKAGDASFTGIASQLLTTKTTEKPEEVLKDPKDETQVMEEVTSSEEERRVDVSRPTTAVKGNDIYMLVGRYISKDCPNSGAGGCGLLLVRGSVSGEVANKKIDWDVTESSPQRLFDTQLGSWTRLIGSGGSGVNMKDEALVFPVEGTKNDDAEEDVKTVSLIISSSKDTTDWTLSKGMSDGGCSAPSVVEWEEGKLMMMTACDDGRRRVYESADKGDSWTEALGTLSRVWGSNQEGSEKAVRSGFITATFGNDETDVMLVTLPVYAKEEGNSKGKLHLWLTDNTHIVDIGPVSDDEDVAASSLLYKSGESGDNNQEELIALYEKKKKDSEQPSPGMVSVLLTEKLKRVKEVLTTWKEVDKRVSNLCTTLFAQKVTSPDTACTTDVKVTAGLVGFLSSKFSDGTWRDEYLGVNATVKGNGATETSDGVKFTGRGAGAEWPVGSQGENQLYHFANYNFTLVATVSIDNVQEEDTSIPLMGVRVGSTGNENSVLLGLSYDSGGKWQLLCGGEQKKELSSTWEKEKTQHVVLLIRNGTQGSVYVDGQRVGNGECALGNGESKEILHFYIGGDGGSADSTGVEEDVSVTVTNVLLYNRPLSSEEIIALNAKLSIPKQTSLKAVKEVTRSPEVRNPPALETVPQNNLGGDQLTAQQSLKTSEDAGGAGASTTAVSTVTNSPAGKESVNKSTPGTSPDGRQTVVARDGDKAQEDEPQKTPAGNPDTADANTATTEGEGQDGSTVNPEAGASSGENGEPTEETNGQEEDVQPQDGDVNTTALSSSLGNVPQGNNSDSGTVSESRMLPSLLLLLLGLWGFAAA
ncbi:trans-sialidase [Trypanosoma cruzi cruzi]|uniref:Putative trans-sialidase, Group V n=1 Tax=Trypanosoma cruzi TaxID=5693 RepID=A0A2V2VUG9_TRYCR|nr:trans-sialidase [Trypanosoma cruzi cruzi]PWU99804.1 putative trans-sialidase, Group V [Trypanosoma cruzi]